MLRAWIRLLVLNLDESRTLVSGSCVTITVMRADAGNTLAALVDTSCHTIAFM